MYINPISEYFLRIIHNLFGFCKSIIVYSEKQSKNLMIYEL